MRRLVAILLLTVTILTFLPVANARQQTTATPADPAQPLGDFMGMVVRDPHYEWNTNPAYPNDVNRAFYDTMGADLKAAGVKWVRIEFFAEESGSLAGKVDTAKYAYFINTVAPNNGLKVLALLATPLVRQRAGADAVSCPNDANDPSRAYPAGQYFDPELLEYSLCLNTGTSQYGYVNPYMKIWLDNAFQIAKAFPYNKATGAGIAAYEVLNEENRYLNGGGKGLKPDAVATLLTKFYRVFKINAGPDGSLGSWRNNVKIILGGLQPDRCTDCGVASPGMTDRDYLNAVYTAKSSPLDRKTIFQTYKDTYGNYPIDGVGYHPYPMEMRSGLVPEDTAINDLFRVPQRMQAIRNVMLQNGDAANKLWITEVGDRGAPITVDPAGDNERRQAQFMRSIYFMLWQDRDFVENVFWFKYEDFEVPVSGVGPSNWGIVRLMPRPADQMQCATCEYDQNGTVQQYKESYWTYQDIAQNGFDTYRMFLPVATR